ncbi:acyltransferase family protein [Cohaesibacter celericrescens]|uniref:acyltransferase family protein n=1 Tax=Cohaesibacter celericrescens TaxID=2067669 RepID=UPI00356261CB
MIKDYGSTNFITGLRAIAASLVVVIHTAAFRDFGWVGNNITDAGLCGVYIFFVISGFSVTQSYSQEKKYTSYLYRRLLRIVPLYYICITITFFLITTQIIPPSTWAADGINSYDAHNLILHYLFISYLDAGTANTILNVEWTLPIEVFWYLLLPLFFPKNFRWIHVIVGALIILSLPSAIKFLLNEFSIGPELISTQFLPFRYGIYFLLGVIAHTIRSRHQQALSSYLTPILALGIILAGLNLLFSIGNTPRMMAFATFFVVIGYNAQFSWLARVFESKILLFVGTLSYGLYLVHYPILEILRKTDIPANGLIGFSIIMALSILTSYLLTRFVEQPIIGLLKNKFYRKATISKGED